MTSKKVIIFSVILIGLIGGLLFFVFSFKKQEETTQEIVKNDEIQKNKDQEVRIVPKGGINEVIISNNKELNLIKNGFKFALEHQTDDFEWFVFKEAEKENILVNDFFGALGGKLDPQLKNLLALDNFNLFSCVSNAEVKSIGILMNFKLNPDYQGNLYQDEVDFMKNWEPSLFYDTQKIIFPEVEFTSNQLGQQLEFKDGKYRYALVTLPGGKNSSINYTIVDDYLLIANDPLCLDKAIGLLYDTTD